MKPVGSQNPASTSLALHAGTGHAPGPLSAPLYQQLDRNCGGFDGHGVLSTHTTSADGCSMLCITRGHGMENRLR